MQAGAEIVNDVSGLRYDPSLAGVVQKHRAGIVLMHLRGTPRTMQQLPPVQRIVPAMELLKRPVHPAHPRAARLHQRAVDIEEHEQRIGV